MISTWRLDDEERTLALASHEGRCPEVIHWGARLPDGEDLAALRALRRPDFSGGTLDRLPDLSICPEARESFPGQPGMILAEADGTPLHPRLMVNEVREEPGRLEITCADTDAELTYIASFEMAAETGVLILRARLEADRPLRAPWFAAPVMPAPQLADEMIDFAGHWCAEFRMIRTPWAAGIRMRDNRSGRTGHEHFPGLILPCRGAVNNAGDVFAYHYGWSGGHRMVAEELPDGRRQVQFGHAAGSETMPRRMFETAPLYATYSERGLNGCAVAFQRHVRDRIVTWPRPERPRPVHYNCWEAVYFDHDLDTLRDIASRAADLGAERFVLDDGWFGRRDDDTSSLGDWIVDSRKYPDGLGPLIDHVAGAGMTFGLWLEPEMISRDSDLYHAHPEWVLGTADQIEGRGQMVLDMSRDEVRDHLFERLSEILGSHAIDYVKWDHNRVLQMPDAAQARGTYALLDRLRAAFPDVEIESCASGGGRIDFGILGRTQRVWLSDSNDALERLRIQHDAALFLPGVVTGSHVGPRRCHTSGRVLDIGFRGWVAAQRHMGFEMDPRELDAHEADVLREITGWWKENRDWLSTADILRLDTVDETILAEQHLARDGTRFVVFAGRVSVPVQAATRPLALCALDPGARYRVSLRNRDEATHLSRDAHPLKDTSREISGSALMHGGITLPWQFPQSMWVLEGERV